MRAFSEVTAVTLIAALVLGSAVQAADLGMSHRHHRHGRHHLVEAEPPPVPLGYAYGGYGNGPGPGWSDVPYGPPGYGPGYGYIPPGSPDAGFDLGR